MQTNGIGDQIVGRVKPLLMQLPAQPDAAVTWLRKTLLRTAHQTEASNDPTWFLELSALVSHLQAWGVATEQSTSAAGSAASGAAPAIVVTVEPFLHPYSAYYDGAIFQVHTRGPGFSEALQGAGFVGVGGRYDSLLQRIWPQVRIICKYAHVCMRLFAA